MAKGRPRRILHRTLRPEALMAEPADHPDDVELEDELYEGLPRQYTSKLSVSSKKPPRPMEHDLIPSQPFDEIPSQPNEIPPEPENEVVERLAEPHDIPPEPQDETPTELQVKRSAEPQDMDLLPEPQDEMLVDDSQEHFPEEKVQEGGCRPGLCGNEAACKPVSRHQYICVCPHDSSPPTADLRCPNRLTVPLTPRPILNIIPLGNNITSNNSTAIPHQLHSDTIEATVLVAAFAASCLLLLAVFSTLCCWKGWKLSQCCPFSQKFCKQQPDHVPHSLNKGLLAVERYAPNPQYTPCSLSDLSSTLSVAILSRDHIAFQQEIGEGCFGKVYKGELKTETHVETVAIKVLKESATREAEEDFMREVQIMSSFKHINILSLIGVALREPNKSPWMVFEFMTHGDLTEVLRSNSRTFWTPSCTLPRLSKDNLLDISTQIAEGMAYLATQRFVHRDLACRNCLVGEGLCVKIADFGMSRDVYTCDYYKIGGSRLLPVRWMSPESVMYGRFTLESDVWSFGVVLWEIFSLGKQPYFGHNNEEVVKLILQGVILVMPDDCPRFICELMQSCWKSEPRDRIRFPEILNILKSSAQPQSTLPRPPAFPVTPQTVVEVLDAENYLKPVQSEPREYLQTLPD